MYKFIQVLSLFIALTTMVMCSPSWARMSTVQDSDAEVELDVRLTVPPYMAMKVGRAGSSVINFNVFGPTGKPPKIEGDDICPFEVESNIKGMVEITADSTQGLVLQEGGGFVIPMTTISYQGTGALSSISGTFDGTPNQLIATLHGNRISKGSLKYIYNNVKSYPAGHYIGTLRFTVSQ